VIINDDDSDDNDDDNDIQCFSQCKTSYAPLSPLRETGYIEVNASIYACGDYTVGSGTFSGALLAAKKLSSLLLSRLTS
jgi:hypothetical protein